MEQALCRFSPVPETGKNSYLDTQQISVQVNSAALRVFPPGVLKIDGKIDFIYISGGWAVNHNVYLIKIFNRIFLPQIIIQ